MPETADPDAIARAAHKHTTVLPDLEEAADADLVGDARVVALGEATHFVDDFGTDACALRTCPSSGRR